MIEPSRPPQYEVDLVEERLGRVRVVLDVLDRVVARDERVDHDRRRDQHQRRRQVERPMPPSISAASGAARPRPTRQPRTRRRRSWPAGRTCLVMPSSHTLAQAVSRVAARNGHRPASRRANRREQQKGRRRSHPTRRRPVLRVVLRRALGHDAVRLHREPVGAQPPLQDDLRAVLERVGNDARVARRHHRAVVLDLEP